MREAIANIYSEKGTVVLEMEGYATISGKINSPMINLVLSVDDDENLVVCRAPPEGEHLGQRHVLGRCEKSYAVKILNSLIKKGSFKIKLNYSENDKKKSSVSVIKVDDNLMLDAKKVLRVLK